MAEERVYASVNDYWSKQKQAGLPDSQRCYGWCVAASAYWCRNILRGDRDYASNPLDTPGKMGVGALQVKYRWDWRYDTQQAVVVASLDGLGVTGADSGKMYRDGALNYMASTPAVYHFSSDRNPSHAMAADTRENRYYFYDIENGLYQYGNLADWKAGIKGRYASRGRVWFAIRCTT